MAPKSDFDVKKLNGSENYHFWKFQMENYLALRKLDKCIRPKPNLPNVSTENDPEKLIEAKSILSLSVETSLIVHIRCANSALEIWTIFQHLYEDKGLLRKTGLLRALMSVRLEEVSSMQVYVEEIMNISNRLSGIGFEIGDEWQASILLAGLTEEYKPFIMSIEGSGVQITADMIKQKLLDSEAGASSSQGNVLYTSKNFRPKYKKRDMTCYNCGGKNHKAADCKKDSKYVNTSENQPANSSTYTSNQQAATAKVVRSTAFSIKAKESKRQDDWYVDSGSARNMTPYGDIVNKKTKSDVKEVLTADDSSLEVKGMGKVNLNVLENNIEVNDCLHVPNLSVNLLSVSRIVKNGNKVVFDSSGCTIFNRNNDVVVQCKEKDGVYKFRASAVAKSMFSNVNNNNLVKWHRRLGHLNYQSMCSMRDNAVNGIKFKNDGNILRSCEICAMGKQSRLPFKSSNRQTKNILDMIHADLCGSMESISIGGAKYFLTFIDDFSRKTFIYFLKSKKEVVNKFIEFKMWAENQFDRKIKVFRTDNGTEFCQQQIEKVCVANGIHHQRTVVYTPQQNGVAERMNRTIVERARCLLFDAELDKSYWAEAANMAVYLINRSVCSALVNKTPEEIWSGSKVDLSHLQLFGSEVMVHIPKQRRQKWDRKSVKLIFVGFDSDRKGYRCIDPITKKLTVSRDVIFLEKVIDPIDESNDEFVSVREIDADSEAEVRDVDQVQINEDMTSDDEYSEFDQSVVVIDDSSSSNDTITNQTGNSSQDSLYEEDETFEDSSSDPEYEPTESDLNNTSMFVRHQQLNQYVCSSRVQPAIESSEPSTVQEAIASHDANNWKLAMKDEIKSLDENNTWSLVDLPPGRKPVKTKWVFKIKKDEAGKLVRHKARLVAKGCSQRYGIDYIETYSPVVRHTSLRFLMALAVKNGLHIDQMDAVTAFMQGDLTEEIYIEQPEGFNDGSNKVCKLNRAINGLKQSGRVWNIKLVKALKSFGLSQSKMDPCVFYTKSLDLLLAIWVDDIFIFWKDELILKKLKNSLSSTFKMKDMGQATNCVGIRITYTDDGICLDQSTYINDVLKRFGMEDCKPVSTPSDVNQKLSINNTSNKEEDVDITGSVPYQELVGCLLFLVQGTRPDIAFAVNDVSRFNSNHRTVHWKAVKRILRYLKGTVEFKLHYTKNGNKNLVGYTDSDWASDVDKRRSCSGNVFKLSNGAISWYSKRQQTVALSSTEAEYMAMASCVQESIWLKQFGCELDKSFEGPVHLLCDNQSAIQLANCDGYRQRTKHIDIRHHYIREKVENGTVVIKYIPTDEMAADNLTKAVIKDKQNFCSKEMGLWF